MVIPLVQLYALCSDVYWTQLGLYLTYEPWELARHKVSSG